MQDNSAALQAPVVKNIPQRRSYGDYVIITLALVCTFIAFSPFGYAILTSLKSEWKSGDIIPFLQFEPNLLNWQQEFGSGGAETMKALRNSSLISLGATLVATTLGTLAGYGLARFKYGIGNRNLVSWFLSQRFLPPVATLIPFVLMFRDLKLLDTLAGMVIVNATFTLPFAVLIMRDYFADLPPEMREAALVDGAGEFTTFLRIALPLARPALVASTLICFAFSWNEFLFASVLANRDWKPYPMLVAGSDTVRGIDFGFVTTRMLIAVTVPVILSLMVQRFIVRGLTFGAVKG
ncbi:MAG: carbohydrate ABC transporter permease [Chloroflexi bacterium]|nr:carbohydrate ABC transporter permease [Chloroflexota bacterium]MCY4248213.1 carbohydrate ABC transporter permease [Chloroflexota bacterium]